MGQYAYRIVVKKLSISNVVSALSISPTSAFYTAVSMWYQNGIIIWDSVQQNRPRVYDFITIKIIIMTVNISLQPYNAFLLNLVHVFTHHVPLFKLILVSSSFFINVNCVHKAHMLHIHLLQSVILSFDFRIFHAPSAL